MKLSELRNGEKAVISRVGGRGSFRKRLMEMGFIPGKTVTVVLDAPLRDPVEYEIMGYRVSLRREEARNIEVISGEEEHRQDIIRVALVGNPNCGKTSLFNIASGSHEHVGNYSGVTVDAKEGHFDHKGYRIVLTDLPGTYSISAYSPEERFVKKSLTESAPDVIINVVDASNLERNLYLTTQVLDLDIRTVLALNMYDELEDRGDRLDTARLEERLGIPVCPTVCRDGKGIPELFDKVVSIYEDMNADERQIEERYAFVHGTLAETLERNSEVNQKKSLSDRIDAIVTGKWAAFPIFIAILYIVFQATFTLGEYPMNWIDWVVGKLGEAVSGHMHDGWVKDLVVDGVIAGVGSVLVFLPNILILYFFISLMEDSGYMARAAFIVDRLMHRIGLHGKSFIPMVMGFGCNVPAIMATRTIESRKSRLMTIAVIPFMSCAGRLPIFVLLAGAFFPGHGALALLGIYLLGVLLAILSSLILKKFIKDDDLPFVMELPPYRIPTGKAIWRHTWEKGRQYLEKMATTILIGSMIVWFLGYFPHETSHGVEYQQENSYIGQIGKAVAPALDPLGFSWKMDIGLLSGVVAKELVVSTLGVMYADDPEEAGNESHLQAALAGNVSLPAAVAFMIFVLLYFPCIATFVAVRNETGKWRWAIAICAYTMAIAWIAAWIGYHITAMLL